MSITEDRTGQDTETDYIFLSGNFAPVEQEVTATELSVDGTIPAALDGTYLRNGPNPMDADPATYHWFTGEGMLHGVRLQDGRADWYRNRWVRIPSVTEALHEDPVPLADGGLFPGLGNTNIVHHAGSIWALMELSLPYEVTPDLDTLRSWNFGGALPAGINAHPKFDPDTGELHVMAYSFVAPFLYYHVIDAGGQLVRTEELEMGGPVMVHDMALTERHAIAFDLPVVFDMDLAMSGSKIPYRWDPEYTPRVGLLPRDGTGADTQWVELDEACYVYHPLNAYDEDGRVVIDLAVHPRAFDDAERGDPSQGKPALERWTVDPVAGKVAREVIDDRGQEFPRADERLATKKHRYGYTAALGPLDDTIAWEQREAPILKHDVVTGTTTEHRFGTGVVPGEFVFVPASPDAAEDEGWLMGYVHDNGANHSTLQILDAQDVAADPVAVVHLPARVPVGFHGNWMPASAVS